MDRETARPTGRASLGLWVGPQRTPRSLGTTPPAAGTWVLAKHGTTPTAKHPHPMTRGPRHGSLRYASTRSHSALWYAKVTGMPPGPQTKARALSQGLITLAQYVLTPVKVIVQLGSQKHTQEERFH